MLGKILKMDGKLIKVENLKKVSLLNIVGYYVVFEGLQNVVGEIVFVNEEAFDIVLIGEIKNNIFVSGVENYPISNSKCRVVYKNELEYIIGKQDITSVNNLLLGKSTVYDGFNVTVDVNDFFSNHFAIIGNTGSGKSCGVARIMQNLFTENKKSPVNSHFVIFDAYGEYQSAFADLSKQNGINVVNYTTSHTKNLTDHIVIPPYFLGSDDLALLLNIKDSELLTILEKALTYVYIFTSNDEYCKKYKNDIIAKALLDILSSGKPAQQLRDQSLAFLSKYYTDEINSDTIISQIGYNRTIRNSLNIDAQGKILSLDFLMEFLKKYSEVNLEKINLKLSKYTLEDLYSALEFAIVSEGSLNSPSIFEKYNKLKTRLYSIINGENRKYFEYDFFVTPDEYIKNLFKTAKGENAQIIDISFNGIDDRFAKVIVKILSKLFYRYTTSLKNRGSFPINIIIEEAHRYIQQDTDIDVIGYNIFDRISKEGRKYGLLLGLITQRLSELSPTALSQCSNFVIFRMYYPEDIKIISSISVNNTAMDIIEKVKSLSSGSAVLFGNAFKVPLVTQFEIPSPMPTSINVNVVNKWYEK